MIAVTFVNVNCGDEWQVEIHHGDHTTEQCRIYSDFDLLSEVDQMKLFNEQHMEVYRIVHLANTAGEAGYLVEKGLAEESDLPMYLREQFASVNVLNSAYRMENHNLSHSQIVMYTKMLARSGSPELALIQKGTDLLLSVGKEQEAKVIANYAYVNNLKRMSKNYDCISCSPEQLQNVMSDVAVANQYEKDQNNREAFLEFKSLISS